MRTIDLALYADTLCGEAAALAARLERARGKLRRAAIEHEARGALPADVVELLERRGLLLSASMAPGSEEDTEEVGVLRAELAAVERFQAWIEARLAEAEREAALGRAPRREEAVR